MLRLTNKSWITIEFKFADMWIGAFWAYKKADYHTINGHVIEDFHLWICIIPCFPIHFIKSSKYV